MASQMDVTDRTGPTFVRGPRPLEAAVEKLRTAAFDELQIRPEWRKIQGDDRIEESRRSRLVNFSAVGFHNSSGAICYLATIVQALFHHPGFAHWLTLHGLRYTQGGCPVTNKALRAVNTAADDMCVACRLSGLLNGYLRRQRDRSDMLEEFWEDLKATKRFLAGNNIMERDDREEPEEHPSEQDDAHLAYSSLIGDMLIPDFRSLFGQSRDVIAESIVTKCIFELAISTTYVCTFCAEFRRASSEIRNGSNTESDFTMNSDIDYQYSLKLGLPHDRPEHVDLTWLIDQYLREHEAIEVRCSRPLCMEQNRLRQLDRKIQTAPELLLVMLERNHYDRETNSTHKIKTKVRFQEFLDLSAYYVSGPELKYRLVSCIHHAGGSGNTGRGHYISFGKNANGEWYEIDDDRVTKLSGEETSKFRNHHDGFMPVILVYMRVHSGTEAASSRIGADKPVEVPRSFTRVEQKQMVKLYRRLREAESDGSLP